MKLLPEYFYSLQIWDAPNKEELKEEKREELEEILKMYPCLGIAYEMKEDG